MTRSRGKPLVSSADVAHRIQRVRHDHQYRLRRILHNFLGDALDDVLVGLKEVVAAHTRLAGGWPLVITTTSEPAEAS